MSHKTEILIFDVRTSGLVHVWRKLHEMLNVLKQ